MSEGREGSKSRAFPVPNANTPEEGRTVPEKSVAGFMRSMPPKENFVDFTNIARVAGIEREFMIM
jgi:hypothetical protein